VWPFMLATASTVAEVSADYDVIEIKYDGFRAIASLAGKSFSLQSRNAPDLSVRFPGVARKLQEMLPAKLVLDGELVARDFQSLQLGSDIARYVVFDCLSANGKDLRSKPLHERRRILEALLKDAPSGIELAHRLKGTPEKALAQMKKRKLEGVVCKKGNGAYHGGRHQGWRKIRMQSSDDFFIVGFQPHSKNEDQIGSLLFARKEESGMTFVGKVGTGFSHDLRTLLRAALSEHSATPTATKAPRMPHAIWVKPRLVAEIAYSEITRDGRLRHPSFQRLREDKSHAR